MLVDGLVGFWGFFVAVGSVSYNGIILKYCISKVNEFTELFVIWGFETFLIFNFNVGTLVIGLVKSRISSSFDKISDD